MQELREPTVGGSFRRRVILSPDRSLAHLVRGSLARPRGGGGGRRGRRRNYGNAEIAVVAEERRPIPQLRSHLARFLSSSSRSLFLRIHTQKTEFALTLSNCFAQSERGRDTSFVTPRHLSEALTSWVLFRTEEDGCVCVQSLAFVDPCFNGILPTK